MKSAGGDKLTHWGRVMHKCISKLTSIGSDIGLSPARHQAIICTNAGILLTHWGRPKMAAISQTTFSWMKMFEFGLKFHWSLFLRVELTNSSIGSDNGLVPSRQQTIIWTNDGQFTDAYMCHSASMS